MTTFEMVLTAGLVGCALTGCGLIMFLFLYVAYHSLMPRKKKKKKPQSNIDIIVSQARSRRQ
ncbi:hypothetical protein pSal_SNUABM02_026 [Salmonella phage pSal-SNUABM-02]|nr:hypothetical protein [Salmonella enterica subsp. enterica serovar Newport]QOI58259.1 hypothetical protein pSal_SNUABM02_026 [Salmonella phage pSal-SNUABM-02]